MSQQVMTDWATPSATGALPTSFAYDDLTQSDRTRVAPPSLVAATSIHTDGTSTASPDFTGPNSRVPGLTTRPGIDEPSPRRSVYELVPRPRALGNTALSVEEIEDLFNM